MQRILFSMTFICSCYLSGFSQSGKAIKASTDVLMFIPSTASFVTSIALKDYQGTKGLLLSGATSISATYILKYGIKKQRPDNSDLHSFPSNHSAIAFQGASFIALRYGWKYSIPAYLISGYVTWGRVYSKRHDVLDVLSGAVIGAGSSYLYTRPFARNNNVMISPVIMDNGRMGIYASISF